MIRCHGQTLEQTDRTEELNGRGGGEARGKRECTRFGKVCDLHFTIFALLTLSSRDRTSSPLISHSGKIASQPPLDPRHGALLLQAGTREDKSLMDLAGLYTRSKHVSHQVLPTRDRWKMKYREAGSNAATRLGAAP